MRRAGRGRRGWAWLGAVALGTTAAVAPPAHGAGSARTTRSGCAATRRAVAYDGNGSVLATQPGGAPAPCMVFTGYGTVETHIVATRDGSVVYEPAVVTPGLGGTSFVPGAPGPYPWSPTSPAGILVSHTAGSSWDFVEPAGSYWVGSDAALYSDPDTGRVFEETLSPGGVQAGGQVAPEDQTPGGHATLLMSPDDGRSWSYTALTGFLYQENARYTSAPPAAGQAGTEGGYPDVTYWCGNRDVGFQEPLILERECYRSLDGGLTWEARSRPQSRTNPVPALFTNPVPEHPECGSNREDINSLDGNYPQGARDGSLYLLVSCTPPTTPTEHGGTVYLARSTDEAATFPILYVPPSGSPSPGSPPGKPLTVPVPAGSDWPELRVARVGHADVLFLVYEHALELQVRTSRDGGLSWSRPLTLTPALTPSGGLPSIDKWAVAVRGSEVAVSYMSRTNKRGYDGWVSVTPDALSTSPVVWSATVNDPGTPLSTSPPQDAKDDFIGVDIGPDGGPWASFFAPCSAAPAGEAQHDPACKGAYLGGRPVNRGLQGGNDRGVVGSLSFGR